MRFSVPIGRLYCNHNNVSLSVQANSTAYCEPREDAQPAYESVEVGFIQGATPPAEWLEYADDGTIDSDVFAYVPIQMVQNFIDDNGGIDIAKTLPSLVSRSFVHIPEMA